MMLNSSLFLLLRLLLIAFATTAATWINVGLQHVPQLETAQLMEAYEVGASTICTGLKGLTQGQGKLCQLSVDHMPSVAKGAKIGVMECQHQFHDRRWNCSTVKDESVFGPVLKIASRETAFVHAITAAGVMYSISRSCRDGQLSSCGCSRGSRPKELNRDWIWGGCGDNLEYGYKFTQAFVDAKEREKKYKKHTRELGRNLMNLRNNEAGRRAVMRRSKVNCKCHGVSGSCSLITCWEQLAPFREIGDFLLDKYDGAIEVKITRRGRLSIKDPTFSAPTPNDLIYLDDSPNYCLPNKTLGSLGTQGRVCNRTSSGMDGCNLLCCGRGYNTQKSTLRERCECKFHWCCFVECKTCVKSIDIHTCK
ncbi:protein Wnt-5b-like [Prorops nasuta]|uniref:protein Wnt-5b-like n=1 Tax=Prorops nasuta TaxID=863751 RepID=UPI0034CFCAEA